MNRAVYSDEHALCDVGAVAQVVDNNAEIIVVSLEKVKVHFKVAETCIEEVGKVLSELLLFQSTNLFQIEDFLKFLSRWL